MSQKKGLTLEQHRTIGSRLGQISDELNDLYTDIALAYPKSKIRDLGLALDRISLIRSYLDDRLAEEHPELNDKTFVNVYYGDLSGRRP